MSLPFVEHKNVDAPRTCLVAPINLGKSIVMNLEIKSNFSTLTSLTLGRRFKKSSNFLRSFRLQYTGDDRSGTSYSIHVSLIYIQARIS